MKKLMMTIVGAVSAMCAFAAELPAGYTAVDAIESTKGGCQYIDTGYTANGQTKVVFDAVIPARWEQNDRFGVLFGSRTMDVWAEKAFALQMCDGNTAVDTVRFAYNGAYRQDGGKPFSFGERVTVTCDGQHVEWTGSKAASVAFTADPLASSKSTLYIFADNSVADDGAKSETGLNPSIMQLYSFKIYDNGTLKRDFVPCVRTADAVAGLYDMVEGKFYGNSGSGNFATSASNLPFGRELASGTYEINESFAFVAPPMESALKIAEGATVTLNIAAGVEVMFRGGDAFEVWGAGAGVEVPANATLKVTGSGQLVAYGGKGANGCDGMAGGNGSADGNNGNFTSGAGGAGGWGGGGAGAGIGGHGASGGGGGNGGQSVTAYGWSYTDIPGNNGDNGGNGKNGGTCGTVSIEGTVKVFAAGGAAGAADGAGGEGGGCAWLEGSTYYFGGWGGGGGGSGSKGGAAQDIGGGGAGGYGGGGGGSGGYLSRYHWDTFRDTLDNGGGGAGTANGKDGYIVDSVGGLYRGSAYPGGAKGTAGARGGSGSLSVAEFAVVFSSSGESDSYSVGRVSVTEHIRWEGGKLYRVVDGVRTEQFSHSVVDADTSSLESGWYVVKGTVSRSKISVNGTVNLVLLHNSSLTASGASSEAGVEVYNRDALNIFGVESGSLTATGGILGAGIGGGDYGVAGTVTINGGVVMATGGIEGAGIGGGSHGVVGTVTINGGVVMATGGESGAGIGGGGKGTDGRVTINGGMVTATGGDRGAGIGGGINRGGFFVTINGGTVTATGNDGGAGIGGGLFGSGGEVTINGGIVTATGNWGGAGIGGGSDGADGKVTLDLTKVEVVDGAVGNGSSYVKIESMTDVLKTEVETFDGNWYVVAPSNVYVNTHFNPDSNTRVTMDVKVQGTGEYWFGCWDRNYNDGAFAFGNDGWGIYAGYGKQGGTFGSVVANGRHTVELNRNVVKVDEKQVNAFNAETFGPLKNNLYLFAQNRNGTLGVGGSQDSIICFGCSISTNSAAGASIPVRNFVPARTKDDQQIVGLYDTVTGWFFAPRDGTLTLGHDESAGPSCEGGTIAWSDAANAWVVTPNAGVTEVTVTGLPEGAAVAVPPSVTKVSGVDDGKIKVRMGAYDITGAFTVSGGAIALDPNGVVTIGGETIPVKPTIGEPFVVGDGEVSVTVRAIPGLKYSLVRGIELGAITMTVVEPTLATEAQMTLEDTDPPAGAAFYKVGVEK